MALDGVFDVSLLLLTGAFNYATEYKHYISVLSCRILQQLAYQAILITCLQLIIFVFFYLYISVINIGAV